ncbi:MAG TPA: NAD-dependent epimerase/dehydratase family protein [Steroidobacteraceae bacterium]|nr:NAD-dependent epimerase/dehydratase family protein [Steroidobacteraceae bacterium]
MTAGKGSRHRRAGTPEGPLTIITGGAGFIGTNLADRLLSQGAPVLVLDDTSRPGVERNLAWLRARHPGRLQVEIADVRDGPAVRRAVDRADRIFHLAAQVAVTTSLTDPLRDFEINVRGTLNVLEAARARPRPPPLLFTSTNKVYGALPDVELERRDRRYVPADPRLAATGIDEGRPLDFHSPYGCSKGAADQYVLDYARCFAVPAVVFRMSCIYGPHQCGTEDQGWVAHFLMRARERGMLTIYGDGCQVRDVLYVDDLVDAMLLAMRGIDRLAGQAFNIGGGPGNSLSLLELLDMMAGRLGLAVRMEQADWRSGDQRYYVTNSGKFSAATGWSPTICAAEGVARLHDWLVSSQPVDVAASGLTSRAALS